MEYFFIIIIIIVFIIYFFYSETKRLERENERKESQVNSLYEKIKSISKNIEILEEEKRELLREEKLKVIEAQKDKMLLEAEIKKDLANYKLNQTMIRIYDEFNEKYFNNLESYFRFKTRPSLKSADYIREIKSEYKRLEKENKELNLILSQFIETEDEELEETVIETEEKAYKYGKIDKETWESLNYIQKLDFILQRYKSQWKDKVNIGLEFERYCGYTFEKAGYQVKYWGILNGKADGGIDLVARNKEKIIYIQCKYWGNTKTIRENTISQLFGASLKMALDTGENFESFIKKVNSNKIEMVIITKTELSEEAKQFCKKLKIKFLEKVEITDYPLVKLVEGSEKIFYIPTDLQYDNISFNSTNKKYSRVYTCTEAEKLGYRHCYKWKGSR